MTGTLNGQNLPTTYYFEYYLAPDGVHEMTPVEDAAVTASDQDVSALLQGLGTGVTYLYRLVATNVDGTAYGEYLSFSTPLSNKAPPCGVTPSCFTPAPPAVNPACTPLRRKLRKAKSKKRKRKIRSQLRKLDC